MAVVTWNATLWLDDIQPVDHDALGLARLLWQYRDDRPRLQGFLEAFLDDIQSIENVSLEVLTGRWPLTAIGDQLDTIGKIVGQSRAELADDPYRIMILGRIFVNLSDGRIDQIAELLVDILSVEDVKIHEMYPAGIHVSGAGMDYPEQVGDLLFDLKGAGVRLDWLYSPEAAGTIFRTSATLGADESTTTEGTANLAGTTGGVLSNTRWQR